MKTDKAAIVYCSACRDIDPKYNQAAADAVRLLCSRGYSIGSGAATKGTMKVVVDAALECGGEVWGAIPRFMSDVVHPGVENPVWTDTMAERKEKMREGTCLALALPGGIGTLDELIETLVLIKLDKYRGKLIALDVDGFYRPFIALLDHYVAQGMLDRKDREMIAFPETIQELAELI